jgi:hypothetical protein
MQTQSAVLTVTTNRRCVLKVEDMVLRHPDLSQLPALTQTNAERNQTKVSQLPALTQTNAERNQTKVSLQRNKSPIKDHYRVIILFPVIKITGNSEGSYVCWSVPYLY